MTKTTSNELAVEEFKKLLNISDILFGPEGCPWDRAQTLVSMRASVLEEACEVIEAIDEGSDRDLIEELGDLLYNIIFFCKLAEKEGRFSAAVAIQGVREKLIARHPHVFGGEQPMEDPERVLVQWEEIKKQQKSHRESLMDGIPKGLPALARGYKIADKQLKAEHLTPDHREEEELISFENEEELGALLWQIVQKARKQKLHPEIALRKYLLQEEPIFRQREKSAGDSLEAKRTDP